MLLFVVVVIGSGDVMLLLFLLVLVEELVVGIFCVYDIRGVVGSELILKIVVLIG